MGDAGGQETGVGADVDAATENPFASARIRG